MNRSLISCIICTLFALAATAQSSVIDKTKVMDYFQEQQFDDAITYLQPAVTGDSANQQALRLLAYAYYMSENVKAAQQCYRKMFANDSVNVTANHYLATIYYNRDPELAMEFFERLIRLQPNTAPYYRSLGELLSRKKLKDSALTFLHQAYTMAPGDARNLVSLTEVLIDVKDYCKADSLLEIGLARDSLNPSFLRSRVRNAYEAKDYPSVLSPGERLISITEVNMSALTKVALAYYNLQQYENCIRVCEYMMSVGLEVEAVYYYEAKAWAKLKNYEKSNEFLELCLGKALSKTAEMYYFTYGENYEATKQFKKAVAAYDTAFYLFKNPLALYSCGRIYEVEFKNATLARQYYTRYLAFAQPVAPDEKKAYAYVKERWGKKQPKK
ncbi:tetratricopeptide repeat protein [Paraflavitalea soli]|nr:tetratricopeptide repeat protein [Paraflavitalea soli]